MYFIKTPWSGLSIFLFILLFLVSPAESQAPLKKPPREKALQYDESYTASPSEKPFDYEGFAQATKKWKIIDGFRSAKFSMTEKQVMRAIFKDFKVSKNKVERFKTPNERTTALVIHVPKLMELGGPADIVYILGYKSKRLMQVNIDWGKGVTENFDGQDILEAANLLRQHFMKKRYQKESYAGNLKVSDTDIIVFRGKDEKGRVIVLRFKSPMVKKLSTKKAFKHVSLLLSYIADFRNQDIFQSKAK